MKYLLPPGFGLFYVRRRMVDDVSNWLKNGGVLRGSGREGLSCDFPSPESSVFQFWMSLNSEVFRLRLVQVEWKSARERVPSSTYTHIQVAAHETRVSDAQPKRGAVVD